MKVGAKVKDYFKIGGLNMKIEEIRKQLEKEANDIEDRIEDLINCYEKGTVDEIIEEQQNELEKISKILKFIGEM